MYKTYVQYRIFSNIGASVASFWKNNRFQTEPIHQTFCVCVMERGRHVRQHTRQLQLSQGHLKILFVSFLFFFFTGTQSFEKSKKPWKRHTPWRERQRHVPLAFPWHRQFWWPIQWHLPHRQPPPRLLLPTGAIRETGSAPRQLVPS
jgi:hypothetical protein